MSFYKKHKGFTLAEVLITIGIIGVVAAVTIPTLITNHQKKVTLSRLKQTFSMIGQAVKLSENENGDIGTWNFKQPSAKAIFDEYLTPFITITQKTNSPMLNSEKIPYVTLSGNKWRYVVQQYPTSIYTTLNGVDLLLFSSYPVTDPETRTGCSIGVDINGSTHGPNRLGKDWFYINVNQTKRVILPESNDEDGTPLTRKQLLGEDNSQNIRYSCNKNQDGQWCGRLIQVDGWEIRKDYPW